MNKIIDALDAINHACAAAESARSSNDFARAADLAKAAYEALVEAAGAKANEERQDRTPEVCDGRREAEGWC